MESRLVELRQRKANGEHLAVIRLAKAILEESDEYTPQELVEAARAGATASMALRNMEGALVCAQAELTVAEQTGDAELTAVAAYHLGTVRMEVGDSHASLNLLDQFLRIDGPGRPALARYRGAVWFNRGTILMWLRSPDESLEAFRRARETFLTQGDTYNVIRCHLQLAWSELTAGRREPAGAYLAQAAELLAAHGDDEVRTTALCHRAYYHFCAKEFTAALELSLEVLLPDRAATTNHHVSEAAWVAGECCLALGELDQALVLAGKALDSAIKDSWASGMNRAGDLRRRILQAKNASA